MSRSLSQFNKCAVFSQTWSRHTHAQLEEKAPGQGTHTWQPTIMLFQLINTDVHMHIHSKEEQFFTIFLSCCRVDKVFIAIFAVKCFIPLLYLSFSVIAPLCFVFKQGDAAQR